MGIDIGRARRALSSAGAPSAGLYWPFGRQGRARVLLRRRLAVLEAKNAVADLLFRTQKPLADLRLSALADIERVLGDPEKRKLVVGLSLSREVIEEELRRRAGTELGRSLDQALSELIREGYAIRVPGKAMLMRDDVYVAVTAKRQPHYEVAELNKLVRMGGTYGSDLRSRSRREQQTTVERSYRL